MDAVTAIMTRKSVRNFSDEKIPEDKLSVILEAGRSAPSGGGNRTARFFVIENKAVFDKLAALAETEFAKMEYDENTYKSLANTIRNSKRGGYVFHYNAPVLVILTNKKGYGNAMADCCCALQNMTIAANALNLGSCYINQLHWLSDNEPMREYLKTLGISEDEQICCSLALGFPKTPPTQRREMGGNETIYIK